MKLRSAERLPHLVKYCHFHKLKKREASPNPKHLTFSLIKAFVSSFITPFLCAIKVILGVSVVILSNQNVLQQPLSKLNWIKTFQKWLADLSCWVILCYIPDFKQLRKPISIKQASSKHTIPFCSVILPVTFFISHFILIFLHNWIKKY